ncbi:hypothetical protein ACS0TY_012856 [Phlomoides rotata]
MLKQTYVPLVNRTFNHICLCFISVATEYICIVRYLCCLLLGHDNRLYIFSGIYSNCLFRATLFFQLQCHNHWMGARNSCTTGEADSFIPELALVGGCWEMRIKETVALNSGRKIPKRKGASYLILAAGLARQLVVFGSMVLILRYFLCDVAVASCLPQLKLKQLTVLTLAETDKVSCHVIVCETEDALHAFKIVEFCWLVLPH